MEPLLLYYQLALGALLLACFGLFYHWETVKPWRYGSQPRWLRLKRHMGLFLVSRWAIWLVFPGLTLGFSLVLTQRPLGMLYQVEWPWAVKWLVGIFALDFVMYAQHRALHFIPWMWRVHRVHHMDKQLDISTGLRFHPLEGLFTVGSQLLGVAFFGIGPLAVITYQIMLGISLFFTHMNVKLRNKTDLRLRKILVTPGMHRIHHSDEPTEYKRNYGFCFSLWDKIIGSYREQPETGYQKVVFGQVEYQDPKYQEFENMLLIPFNPDSLKVHPRKAFVSQYGVITPPLPEKPKPKRR